MTVPYTAHLFYAFFFMDVPFPSFETLKRMSGREAEVRKAARGREAAAAAADRPGSHAC